METIWVVIATELWEDKAIGARESVFGDWL